MGDVKIVSHWHLESSAILISCSVSCGTCKESLSPPAPSQQSFCISMLLSSILLASPDALNNSLLQYVVLASMFPIAFCSPEIASTFLFHSSSSIVTCVLICHPVHSDATGNLTFLSFFQLVSYRIALSAESPGSQNVQEFNTFAISSSLSC